MRPQNPCRLESGVACWKCGKLGKRLMRVRRKGSGWDPGLGGTEYLDPS